MVDDNCSLATDVYLRLDNRLHRVAIRNQKAERDHIVAGGPTLVEELQLSKPNRI